MSIVSIFSSFLNFISFPTNKLRTSEIFPILIMKVLNESLSILILRLICEKIKITDNLDDIYTNLRDLRKLYIIEKDNEVIYLNTDFKTSILKYANKKFKTRFNIIKEIKRNNLNIFNTILHQFVENSINSKLIFELFLNSHLITKSGNITSKGFDFLLKSNKEQLWFLILEILKNQENEFIEFVFELFICKPNYKYFINNEIKYIPILKYLSKLGLLYYEIIDNIINIEITELVSNLIKENIEDEKFIIIETNYRFYGYTTQKHQIAILKLFCSDIEFLSDFIVGKINEASVKNALNKGISAYQITNFLNSHSKNICFTIKEQIQIWEAKNQRFQYEKSVMLNQFNSFDQFNNIIKLCKDENALLYFDNEKEIIILKSEYYKLLKDIIKKI